MNKAYPKYKPTGVEWLDGDGSTGSPQGVPEHWEVKKGRLVGILQSTVNVSEEEQSEEEGKIDYIKVDDLNTEGNMPVFCKSKLKSIEMKKPFVRNALIFPKRGAAIFTNKVSILNHPGLLDPNMMGWQIDKKYELKFFYYVLTFRRLDDLADTSTVPQINNKHIYPEYFPVPSLPEQQAIAAFLDRETGRIDSLIAKKERLLELLAEQRTALISATVTGKINVNHEKQEMHEKGKNENFRDFRAFRGYESYKPSGVEWLGDVPEHWEVKRLKHLTKKIIDNRGRTPEFGDEGIPMLEVKQITEGKRFPTNSFEKFVEESIVKQYERERVLEGDILISTVGATSGKAVIVDKNPSYFIAQNVIGVRPIPEVNNVFFYYSIASDYFVNSLLSINKSNTIDNLKVSIFINNYCLFPPLPEQQAIASFLDRETAKIDALSAKVTTAIERLKEYRTALISSAVTGKIDVREAV